MEVVLKIEGMSCGGCAASVEKALRGAGADNVRVDLPAGKAFVGAQSSLDAETLRRAVDEAGYEAAVEA